MAKDKKHPATPKDSWEIRYSPSVMVDSKTTRGEQFNPKRSSERMTTYVKVNREDH